MKSNLKQAVLKGKKKISPVIPHSNQYYFSIFVSSFVYIALTDVLESKGNHSILSYF